MCKSRPKVWTEERVATFCADHAKQLKAAQAEYEAQTAAGVAARDRPKDINVWKTTPRPRKIMVWTPEQTSIFLELASGHRLCAMFHLFAMTGPRRGEVAGASWPDLDKKNKKIAVEKSRVKVGSEVIEGDTKSEAGERDLMLDDRTIKWLEAHRSRQDDEQDAAGESWIDSGKIFTTEIGAALDPDTITELFDRLAFEAGLSPVRPHDLRHGTATPRARGWRRDEGRTGDPGPLLPTSSPSTPTPRSATSSGARSREDRQGHQRLCYQDGGRRLRY